MDEVVRKLGIDLAVLTDVPAWQVVTSSPLIAALRDIEDPFIPAAVTDPPFAEVLRRFDEMTQRHAS